MGVNKLYTVFKRIFYAPNSAKDIKRITTNCIECRANKVYTRKIKQQYAPPIRATYFGELVSIDIYGPLPNISTETKYLVVAKDIYSNKTWLG